MGHPKACGRMAAREGGVDLACAVDGHIHTLRLRYCLDAKRRVRLLGTGVVYGALTRVEVHKGGVRVSPARHKHLVTKCVHNARQLLADTLRAYLQRFPPATVRLIKYRDVVLALKHMHTTH